MNLPPIEEALNCTWNYLLFVLETLDSPPPMWWWIKDIKREDRKAFRRGLKDALKLVNGYLIDGEGCKDLRDREQFVYFVS